MKRKKKILISVTAGVIALLTLLLLTTSALAVSIGSRSVTDMFDYNGGSGWKSLDTPEHYVSGSSPEQVAYCLQHSKSSPSNATYSDSDILGSYSTHVQTGLRIIFENGYPYGMGGLTATEARYATANAVRFWLSENGESGQYNFTNLGAYSDSQLRSYAANGQIGSKIRARSGYTDVLQFSVELLIKARSQSLMAHTVNMSTPSMSISGGYFVGTSTISLTNMNGGYTLSTSGLPSGSSVTGYTGQSSDTLTIWIPVSEANANRSFSLSVTGKDNRTRSNMFAYAPGNSSLQRVIVAKSAEFHDAQTVGVAVNTPQIYADLTITSLSSNASSYDAGDTITITATVKNQGLSSASGFYVSLTSTDLSTQTRYISSLAAGSSTSVTFSYTAGQYTADKTITVTMMADSTGAVAESNESNNTRSASFKVLKMKQPDLIVSALTASKAEYTPGELVSISATIRNQGESSAGGFYVALTSPDLTTQTKYVSSLAVGGTTTVIFTYTAPTFTSTKTVTVTATADSTGIVAESNESNNTKSASFNVLALPDLTVTSLTGDIAIYEAGETVTVSAVVKNVGATSSAATTVRLTVPNIGTFSGNLATLGADVSRTVAFTFTAPTELNAQSITVTAFADPDNKVVESNESNNSRTVTISVKALRPDIEIVDSTITDWYAGKEVTVSATVRNNTAQPVPSVAIRLTIGGVSYTENIPIAGNGSNLVVFRITVPASGSYTVKIVADPNGALDETNKNNNTLSKSIQVQNVPTSIVADSDDTAMEQRYTEYGLSSPSVSASSTYHTWQEVRLESGNYATKAFYARLTTTFSISPDSRIAYPDRPETMESGFGFSVQCTTTLNTNYDHPEKLVGAQIVWVRYPESSYGQLSAWQYVRDDLEAQTGTAGSLAVTWRLAVNPYSVTESRLHYTPLWYPDGEYIAWAQAFYAWSPVGQLYEHNTDTLTIEGDMYDRVTTIQR